MRYFEHAHTLIRHGWPPHVGRDGMPRFQARKLRSIVAHCRDRVAVYRDHWRDAELASAAIAAPEAVRTLPVIGKDDLRSRPLRDTLAEGADPAALVRHETSGSSGQPFAIYRSPFEEHLLQLFRMRALADAGVRFDVTVVDRFPRGPHAKFRPYVALGG
jgi:phenylacetate-coenzyme A ligase PaaK-like adenylate-forming protein